MHLQLVTGRYFTTRFPGLFMACYAFALRHCVGSGPLMDYLPPDAGSLMVSFLADNRPGRKQVPDARELSHSHNSEFNT